MLGFHFLYRLEYSLIDSLDHLSWSFESTTMLASVLILLSEEESYLSSFNGSHCASSLQVGSLTWFSMALFRPNLLCQSLHILQYLSETSRLKPAMAAYQDSIIELLCSMGVANWPLGVPYLAIMLIQGCFNLLGCGSAWLCIWMWGWALGKAWFSIQNSSLCSLN